jgi:prephenate dehydrogenase
MEDDFSRAQVTIVGLGLMGGSLAAALSTAGACRRVVGVARRPSTLATAQALRFISWGTTDLAQGVAEADLVVLATPVSDILEKIGQIGPLLKPGCVLMDLGSTKGAICAAMAALPPHVEPVGGHPMCGKESSGLTMAEPGLYRERVFVLAPLARTSPAALSLARSLVAAVGAREVQLDPARHDRLVAIISHLPYAMAVSLVMAAEQLAAADELAGEGELAWRLAAGGFRDTSRVAAGSIPMMRDILSTNRGAIVDAVREAERQLGHFADLLEAGEDAALEKILVAARDRRMEVFP